MVVSPDSVSITIQLISLRPTTTGCGESFASSTLEHIRVAVVARAHVVFAMGDADAISTIWIAITASCMATVGFARPTVSTLTLVIAAVCCAGTSILAWVEIATCFMVTSGTRPPILALAGVRSTSRNTGAVIATWIVAVAPCRVTTRRT